MVVLPDFGNDWLTDTPGMYIIISLELSTDDITIYWGPYGLSFTDSLVGAGIFSESMVKEIFDKGDVPAVPIPCTRDAFLLLGMYPVTADYHYLDQFNPIKFSQNTG